MKFKPDPGTTTAYSSGDDRFVRRGFEAEVGPESEPLAALLAAPSFGRFLLAFAIME